MVDLRTLYMGLELANPLVASSGPVTERLDSLLRLEEAGVGAVVLPSLFEEEIVEASMEVNALLSQGTNTFGEALSYLPELPDYGIGPERLVDLVAAAKERLSVPVIASLNGSSAGGWLRYAKDLQEAGADAIELNVYVVPVDGERTAEQVEQQYLDLVRAMRAAVAVPLAVKVGPYFTSTAHMAVRLDQAGIDALVLFNRFYQPDIDLETLEVVPTLSLSHSEELRLRLMWTAALHGRVGCSLAVSGGVHTPEDVVKAVLAGADVAMTTAALLRDGPGHVATLRVGLERWLEEHEYVSVSQARGSVSRESVPDPDAYARANYVKVLRGYSRRFLAAQ